MKISSMIPPLTLPGFPGGVLSASVLPLSIELLLSFSFPFFCSARLSGSRSSCFSSPLPGKGEEAFFLSPLASKYVLFLLAGKDPFRPYLPALSQLSPLASFLPWLTLFYQQPPPFFFFCSLFSICLFFPCPHPRLPGSPSRTTLPSHFARPTLAHRSPSKPATSDTSDTSAMSAMSAMLGLLFPFLSFLLGPDRTRPDGIRSDRVPSVHGLVRGVFRESFPSRHPQRTKRPGTLPWFTATHSHHT